jgi:hypothetical protein
MRPIPDFWELQKKEALDTPHNKKTECGYAILKELLESETSPESCDGLSPVYLPK